MMPNPGGGSARPQSRSSEQNHRSVRLTVFNLFGRGVAFLVDESKSAGTHRVTFGAADLPSGVYVYQLQWKGAMLSRRMTLLRYRRQDPPPTTHSAPSHGGALHQGVCHS